MGRSHKGPASSRFVVDHPSVSDEARPWPTGLLVYSHTFACTWFSQRRQGLSDARQPGDEDCYYFAAKDVCCCRLRAWYAWSSGDVCDTAAARLTEAEARESARVKERECECCCLPARSVASSRSQTRHLFDAARDAAHAYARDVQIEAVWCLHKRQLARVRGACSGSTFGRVSTPSILTTAAHSTSFSGLLGPQSETLACLASILGPAIAQGETAF